MNPWWWLLIAPLRLVVCLLMGLAFVVTIVGVCAEHTLDELGELDARLRR